MAERVELSSAGRLGSFVRRAVVTQPRGAGQTYVRFPNGEVDLAVSFTGAGVGVHVLGARTKAVTKTIESDLAHAIVLRFKAGGAYPFFGVPVSELTDRAVSIDTLWGPEAAHLRDALAGARSPAAALLQLEAALAARLAGDHVFEPASAALVRRAVRQMRESGEAARVDELARNLGMSARNLRRAFHEVVGMGPKEFARIVRFQRALRAVRSTAAPDWGSIANDAGYYDQSHLIAEFRALAGATPAALPARVASAFT